LPASQTKDFFRGRLDQMIDLRHPLAVLSTHMPWQEIEASLAGVIARKVKAGRKVEDIDLFGPVVKVSGGVSNAGRPRLPMRLMVSLLYLKHTYNLSDEELVAAWSENVYYQFFSGREYYEPKAPCDFTLISKFRKLIGEEGVEELLAKTITVAVEIGLIKPEELKKVVVDSTVMPKAIAHPTDSKLLETSRDKLVEVARANGITLKQTFEREGKYLTHKAGRYGHAKQFRRMRKVIKRQGTIVGRLSREIARKANVLSEAVQEALMQPLGRANRIRLQVKQGKNAKNTNGPKIYSWHAPEVSCIAKGKAKTPYEFGTKVGIATTARQNLIVGARSFANNPFDGHTLAEQIEQATILMQDTAITPQTVYVDRGYRLKKEDRLPIRTLLPDMKHLMTEEERKLASRRQAIEPIIGHLKSDHRLDRCYLKGQTGDAIHAVLCAAGYNIKWLMRMILQKGIKPFLFLFFAQELGAFSERLKKIAAQLQTNPINLQPKPA
jgi:transposase, IS5 family